MRYHGNYCGPNWSAGKHQGSVISDVPALDDFDETCKVHDHAYALDNDLRQADLAFARANILTSNPKRVIAGLLVGAQGLLRPIDRPESFMNKSRTILRGNQPQATKGQKGPKLTLNTTRRGNDVSRAAPVAVATRRTGKAPSIKPQGTGVVISHRTFLGPIVAQAAFNTTTFSANPGIADTFPWLSKVATRYDKYRFTRLRFEYRSVCATSSTGVVMMSFDYNAADAPPASKAVQAQTIPNAENNVWMNNDLVVPCDPTWRFVRQGPVANTDVKTYDLGNMVLSTLYGAATTTGELYVEYTVELDKPSEPEALASFSLSSSPLVAGPLLSGVGAGITPLQITGIPVFSVFNSSILTARVGGVYLISYQASGSSITAMNMPIGSSGVGITTVQAAVINAAATSAVRVIRVRVDRGDTIDWSAVISAATTTFFSWTVTEWF